MDVTYLSVVGKLVLQVVTKFLLRLACRDGKRVDRPQWYNVDERDKGVMLLSLKVCGPTTWLATLDGRLHFFPPTGLM